MEFKKSQLWITLPNLGTPGGCTVYLKGKEARKDKRMTYFLPKQFPPIQASDLTPSVENACGDHQGGLNGYRASLWHNQELKFINSFYCLILLFCGAQSQISYSRPYKVNFIFATLCLRSACSLLLGRSNIKCAFDYFNLSLTGSSHS